jgi:hypothetical protein
MRKRKREKSSRMDADYDAQYAAYQLKSAHSWIRSCIRAWYLRSITAHVTGSAVDFGCGMGGLLAMLPKGSCGFDVNVHAVTYSQARGLQVHLYNPAQDAYRFEMLEAGRYKTFIMNHVLEHFDDVPGCFTAIAASCRRLDVERIILVLPQRKGFYFDTTHKTVVDVRYMRQNGLHSLSGYEIRSVTSFPFPEFMGKYFTHNELRLIYEAA